MPDRMATAGTQARPADVERCRRSCEAAAHAGPRGTAGRALEATAMGRYIIKRLLLAAVTMLVILLLIHLFQSVVISGAAGA